MEENTNITVEEMIDKTEKDIIKVINDSNLNLAIISLILKDILANVRSTMANAKQEPPSTEK